MELRPILEKMVKMNASDLHLKVGLPPILRIHSRLAPLNMEPLSQEDLKESAASLMTKQQQEDFIKRKEADFAVGLKGLARFRVNVYIQRGSISIAMRTIPHVIKSIDELNLPSILKDISLVPRGLILATGTTGSGKSTTLAAMIEYINQNTAKHIITVEDPIEYLFKDKKSVISQREVGTDTFSFADSLRYILRQDPDVIMIGEIRDIDTMDTALKAADTGHVVLSTLHTLNASETINRIISFYPPHQQQHIRVLLSATLIAVISLRLLPLKNKEGMIPATEIMVSTPTIREYLIDPVKTLKIPQAIIEGSQYGMHSFDQCIMDYYKKGIIDYETALNNTTNPDEFKMRLKGIDAITEVGWGGN